MIKTTQHFVTLKTTLAEVRGRLAKLLKDRLFTAFVASSLLVSLASISLILWRVRPTDFAVPLRYSSAQGFDTLGAWYRVYNFAFFTLLVTVSNLLLAAFSLEKSRIASFFLVMGSLVINIFTLVVVLVLTAHLEV